MSGNMLINQDFKEFIQLLNTNEVKYLVIGGYAVAFHGHPRYTKDLDIWIQKEPDNVRKLIRALDAFGFGSLGLKEEDFLEPDVTVQLGYPPNRIDLLTDPPGIDFMECDKNHIKVVVDDVEVCFIDLDGLKANKRAVGRHQDLADLEHLE